MWTSLTRIVGVGILSTGLACALATPGMADDGMDGSNPEAGAVVGSDRDVHGETWEFEVTPYLWISSMEGEVSARGVTAPIDVEFADILGNLDLGALFKAEARHGDWAIMLDTVYMKVSDRVRFAGPGPIGTPFGFNAEVETAIVELGGAYRLLNDPLGGSDRRLTGDILAGGRYWHLEQDIEPLRLRELEATQDWIDPFVGGRVNVDASEKLSFGVRADVGGFGIGDASEVTWNLVGLASYHWTEHVSIQLGYRVLDVDRQRGSGAAKRGAELQMHGPTLGLSFHF